MDENSTIAQAWRDFEAAWNDFVLAFAKSLRMDRFVEWLANHLGA